MENENNSSYGAKRQCPLYKTPNGYDINAVHIKENMEKYLHIVIEGGPQGIWKSIDVKESSLRKQNAVIKTVREKFCDLVDDLATEDTILEVANAIERQWKTIPTTDNGSESSPTAIYARLRAIAEEQSDRRVFLHDEDCYIKSTDFNAVLEEQGFRFTRCHLLKEWRIRGVLVTNTNRNELKRKLPWMDKQERFICLRSLKSLDASSALVSNDACERYVELGDGVKNTIAPYTGGKNNTPMQEKIQAVIPYNIEMLAEIFAGSASVAYNCRKAKYYHLNDLDSNISNLHSVVIDTSMVDKLMEAIDKCDFSKEEFAKALERSEKSEHEDKVEWALDELVLLHCSYNANRKAFSRKGSVDELRERIKYNIQRVHEKAKRSEYKVTNEDALVLLREYCEQGDDNIFLYIDPPYRQELCSSKQPLYRHVLTEEKQELMLSIIQNAKCPILLSGYKNEKTEEDLYCKYLDVEHGWVCLKLGDFHKSSSSKKGSIGEEYVWLNYFDRLPEVAKYLVSMQNHGLEKGGACNE